MSNAMWNQREIANLSAAGRIATRTAAKSAGFAILADRPSHIERQGINIAEQMLATGLILVMLAVTGATWFFLPAVGAALSLLGVFFIARRAAAFEGTPMRVRNFFSTFGKVVPSWWTITSLSLIAFATLHRSVVLELIPTWMRENSTIGAQVAIIVNFGFAIAIGIRWTRDFDALNAQIEQLQDDVSVMLGVSPRVFEKDDNGNAGAYVAPQRDGSVVVIPQTGLELDGVENRLRNSALGDVYEVGSKAYRKIILVPISDEALERVQTLRASGGLIEGVEDLSAPLTSSASAFEPDADDPWGDAAMPAPSTPTNDADGTVSFGEEAWS